MITSPDLQVNIFLVHRGSPWSVTIDPGREGTPESAFVREIPNPTSRNQDDSTMDLTELAVAMGSLLFPDQYSQTTGNHDGLEKYCPGDPGT